MLETVCVQVLLMAASQDADAACRAAAHKALSSAPLAAATIASLLAAAPRHKAGAGGSGGATGKRRKALSNTGSPEQQGAGEEHSGAFVAALELLQWHAGLQGEAELVGPLSGLLPGLLAGANATSAADDEGAARCASQHTWGSSTPW